MCLFANIYQEVLLCSNHCNKSWSRLQIMKQSHHLASVGPEKYLISVSAEHIHSCGFWEIY